MFAVSQHRAGARRSAFTLVELIAVMVVLAILAGVAAPRFFSYGDQARTAALEGSLGGMRSAVAQYYAMQAVQSTAAYPTLLQLTTVGVVMQESLPKNPYNGMTAAAQVNSLADANNRVTANTDTIGWNYFFDNASDPPVAIVWANSITPTQVSNSNGDPLTANRL